MNFVKKIIKAEPYKLTLEFDDGEVKIIDLEDKIKSKSSTTNSKYRQLLDFKYFKRVKIQKDWETIYWDNGLDFCPDVLYRMGSPVARKKVPVKQL